MKTIIYDVECNGLLDTVTKVWCIAATNVQGDRQWLFTDEKVTKYHVDGSLEDGVDFLLQFDRLVCHNCTGYDTHIFHKFWPEKWNLKTVPLKRHWDTLIQSKAQHYDRPRLKGTKSHHGLEYFGLMFKYPKVGIEDWTYFDEDKLERVLVDIEINRRTYNYLNSEAEETGLDFEKQIRRTQGAQYWYTIQELHGTYGDKEYMRQCVQELDEMIENLAKEIEPNLPTQLKVKASKCTWEDIRDKWKGFYRKVPKTRRDEKGKPIKPTYMPVINIYKKNGDYQAAVSNWFDIPSDPKAQDKVRVAGPYTRIEYERPKMSQHAIVKDYLLSIGWKPTQWNYEKDATGRIVKDDAGNPIKKSPKLTEDSYDSIEGDIGQKIATYNTYTHRRRTIENEKDDSKGWLNQIREDGRIAAGCMAWSTSTGRGAQKGIVNVPSTAATYGYPMRRSWIAPEGKVLISVDQNSAQIRLLANYMGDPEYTEAVIHGEEFDEDHNYVGTDAHTINAMAFGTLPSELVERARNDQQKDDIDQASKIRKKGKNGFYALLSNRAAS